MSLTSWKKEFYPKAASRTTKAEAAEHSLRKWRGVLPENLKKHGVEWQVGYEPGVVGKEEFLAFSVDECALCTHHYAPSYDDGKDCPTCPLTHVRACCMLDTSPYARSIERGTAADRLAMVRALEKAAKLKAR